MGRGFPGFPPEGQYWQFPTIINGFVDQLSGSEFKILWYILRHTYGFQKSSDKISIPQIMRGIRKRSGEILDVGTGIKHRGTVVVALKKLEKLGFIRSVKRTGKTTEFYPLVQKMNPIQKTDPTSTKNEPLPVLKNEPTIDTTIDNSQYSKKDTVKRKGKYSSLKDIKEQDLVEIAARYNVSVSFVKLQFEKMQNWLEAKGKRYKNYRRALMNWVLSDRQDGRPRAVEVPHVKLPTKAIELPQKPIPKKRWEQLKKVAYSKIGR